jgi:glycosyltransferase involved in cell wall biosynthesis
MPPTMSAAATGDERTDLSAGPRVCIVAENASARFGGEAILPLHYFRLLRQRGVDARLVVNARTRSELNQLLPAEQDRIHYVPDTWAHRLLFWIGRPLPGSVRHFSVGLIARMITGWYARRMIRTLVRNGQVNLVHQPTPVSPKEASMIYDVGAPVVIGPMNGGINYPPGFKNFQRIWVRAFIGTGRLVSHVFHKVIPGKMRAQTLLVANARTAAALPRGAAGQVQTLVENGVDLSLWHRREGATEAGSAATRFVFSGRLVDWKGVQYLIQAYGIVRKQLPEATLQILGDGPMRSPLEAQTTRANLARAVRFAGWTPQPQCAEILGDADVFVLPSLYECGGAVVLEAMASGLPVIATDWGGPADYLDPTCGVLIPPGSPAEFPIRLADAMLRLARDPGLRKAMGDAGRAKAEQRFDWQRKIDAIMQVYADTLARAEADRRAEAERQAAVAAAAAAKLAASKARDVQATSTGV